MEGKEIALSPRMGKSRRTEQKRKLGTSSNTTGISVRVVEEKSVTAGMRYTNR